jgi:hypothetical protein
LVPARGDRREKAGSGRADGFMADDRTSVTEAKLRIRREQLNEGGRVARIDDCEHTLPPCTIGRKDTLWYDGGVHRITNRICCMRFGPVEVISLGSIRDAKTTY